MVDSGARAEVARSHNDSHLCVGPSIRANPGHIHQLMNYSLAFWKSRLQYKTTCESVFENVSHLQRLSAPGSEA